MDEYKIKKIIEKLLSEHSNKKALIIITGGNVYSNEIFEILKKKKDIKYEYIESENSTKIIDIEKIDNIATRIEDIEKIEESIQESDFLIVPFLTRNTLSKVALGIADTKATTSIQLALMMGKKVISLDASWNPESEAAKIKKINANNAYNKMLFSYKEKAEKLGMKSIAIYDLEKEIDEIYINKTYAKEVVENDTTIVVDVSQAQYITCEDILGKDKIYLSKNQKFTDLAKEYVLEKNVKIIDNIKN
ncbi:flavoprotein [[Clostridium] dakarense]|uniref:flavoprotein n=1 Tax=Faecalimicrobium dakarense TaxID=1301100 RepID=UPI0004B6E455|nr:flavoprotein [[Clostridium] dakarense]